MQTPNKKPIADSIVIIVVALCSLGLFTFLLYQRTAPPLVGQSARQDGEPTPTANAATEVATITVPPATSLPEGGPPLERPTPDLSGGEPLPTRAPDAPYHVAASSYRTSDPENYTKESEVVIIGNVKEIDPARWSTPDGNRPANPFDPDRSVSIFRPAVISVDQYFKGEAQQNELMILIYGGQVGDDTAEWVGDDLYAIEQGDRVVLFLKQYTTDFGTYWGILDKFEIDEQGIAFNSYKRIES